jgi:hypothetical protein
VTTRPSQPNKPNERQLRALTAIASDDQGQAGDLDIFAARECEAFGWVTKVDGAYRLTPEGKRVLDGTDGQNA